MLQKHEESLACMSSRVDYQSARFSAATADFQTLQQWTETEFKKVYGQTQEKYPSPDTLLACAELAIRLQDASTAQQCLERVLKLRPQEADAYYLKAMLSLGQGQGQAGLQILEQACHKHSGKGIDWGRLWYLLATQRLQQQQDLKGAIQALNKACELVAAPPFLHTTSRPPEALTPPMLAFDFALFDKLYPWEGGKTPIRLCALATGPQDQLYIIDNYNRWIFEFSPEGKFIRGLDEHQLSGHSFLYPESRWDLTDLCVAPDGRIFVAGQQDTIGVFSPQWEKLGGYAPPATQRRLRPLSLSCDSQGNLYVLYQHLTGIQVFNREGFHQGSFGKNTTMPTTDCNYFCGLSSHAQDQICLYDREKIQIFSNGQCLRVLELPTLLDTQADYPLCWNGIASGPDHTLWLADTAHQRILFFQPNETQAQELPVDPQLQPLAYPFDITVDSQGVVYLADTHNARVLKYQHQQWHVVFAHPNFEPV